MGRALRWVLGVLSSMVLSGFLFGAGCLVGQQRTLAAAATAREEAGDAVILTGYKCEGTVVGALKIHVPHDGDITIPIPHKLCKDVT
jgi:hypothetical protein